MLVSSVLKGAAGSIVNHQLYHVAREVLDALGLGKRDESPLIDHELDGSGVAGFLEAGGDTDDRPRRWLI